MTALPRKLVLDASAVLAWLRHERGWETIDKVLSVSVLPASAMVETLYRAKERGITLAADALHQDLLSLGIEVESVTDADTVRAAELIGESRAAAATSGDSTTLSLGDGLCLAVAERLNLTVTGGDQHWSEVALRVPFIPFRR